MWMKRAVRVVSAALGCLLIAGTLAARANAQAAPAASAADGEACPAHVRVYQLRGLTDELAFAVWADDGGATASGTIVAYVNGGKYTIPFTNAVIPDERDATATPTPIVVKFDAPVNFESAYLGSIEGTPCAIHSAFLRKPLTRSGLDDVARAAVYPVRDWSAYLAKAAALPPLHAPAPEAEDKPACKQLYAEPTIAYEQPPALPEHTKVFFGGTIVVRVDLDATGKATALRLDKPNPDKDYDHSALIAAAQSKFTPEIFRCHPITANVYYSADFDAHSTVTAPGTDRPDATAMNASHNR